MKLVLVFLVIVVSSLVCCWWGLMLGVGWVFFSFFFSVVFRL